MKVRGSQVFADELARFAAECDDARVSAIAAHTGAPLRAVVRGRAGVGRGTVARALAHASGITVMPDAGEADVTVQVIAEVVKPEDVDAIAAADCPVLTVLNKADLAGSLSGRTADGPLAAARTRGTQLAGLTGAAVEPMIALLAVAALEGLDATSWAALRTLAAHPACLEGSFEEFVAADNPVPTHARLRLLETLDLFGTALGIAAIRRGATLSQVCALLRRISGVDVVVARLWAVGAQARYRRVLEATAELEALAVGRSRIGEQVSGFLSRDDTVLARMAAAVEAADAAGLDTGPDVDDDLARAVRWQRDSRGSADDLRRACGADIARGSLRLWSRTRESS
ncbi:hypothetical protein [Mycobacterium stomatepiae]|uniref:Uncharacterized protein n=1 Tax=Mycobacterium stomatepiae TaxID=470076 RepID=A0A7I7QB86_9MYCO|nr:hypothetical protein [Mycobacterium stomatepiae]MCV7163825.1 hypothetical protein [Mycobacterium stomatepiae]BBY23306.1 hypothetical protein MSTO_35110 [Mycobacterium stomatepiae]